MRVFRKKESGPELTRSDALGCVPVKNGEAVEERMGEGEVILSWPVRVRPWLMGVSRFFGGAGAKPRVKRLQLDQLGTAVWDLMDGRAPVRKLAEDFAAKFDLHPKEAEVAVTHFLHDLGKRGLIGLK